MVNVCNKKRTLGRRKIEIKKIDNKSALQVTFSKRRAGLFNKAIQLALLCGSQIAILVQSPSGKIYSCGHPHVDAVINRFLTAATPPPLTSEEMDSARREYEEAVMRLEMEKRRMKSECWWNEPYEGLELHALEEYWGALQVLTENVWRRAEIEELEKMLDE